MVAQGLQTPEAFGPVGFRGAVAPRYGPPSTAASGPDNRLYIAAGQAPNIPKPITAAWKPDEQPPRIKAEDQQTLISARSRLP